MTFRRQTAQNAASHRARTDGTPVFNPLWYKFPKDAIKFGIDTQFFFGHSDLVTPTIEEDTTTRIYYQGGATVEIKDVNIFSIPVYIMGGVVLPLREHGAMATTELRKTHLELVVAPALDGSAAGTLYLDDRISLGPTSTTTVSLTYKDEKLTVEGAFGHPTDVKVARVRFARRAEHASEREGQWECGTGGQNRVQLREGRS
ncbi:hypothetical protein BD413DRAFT_621909 [Trametes elegans]|nr:hypothetical protein BD413DRAFT_621909 [Trametes elegans]